MGRWLQAEKRSLTTMPTKALPSSGRRSTQTLDECHHHSRYNELLPAPLPSGVTTIHVGGGGAGFIDLGHSLLTRKIRAFLHGLLQRGADPLADRCHRSTNDLHQQQLVEQSIGLADLASTCSVAKVLAEQEGDTSWCSRCSITRGVIGVISITWRRQGSESSPCSKVPQRRVGAPPPHPPARSAAAPALIQDDPAGRRDCGRCPCAARVA